MQVKVFQFHGTSDSKKREEEEINKFLTSGARVVSIHQSSCGVQGSPERELTALTTISIFYETEGGYRDPSPPG